MAITNTKLQITDLDFDTIKSNLKTFLQGQSELTDYDFSGSMALARMADGLPKLPRSHALATGTRF